ncbi:MAG: hypothetical protein Q8O67_17620 [Deltaproteobacteria bacterium]|nr:hypothetical protein [Deltaproteobacteria bacterium]
MRFSVVVALVFAAAPAAPAFAESQTFIGWDESGHVSYLSIAGAPGTPAIVRACRTSGDDVPPSWPTGLSVGPGVLCADLGEDTGGVKSAEFAKREAAKNKALPASPVGLKVELAVEGTRHTLTISDGPEKKLALPAIESAEPLKLAPPQWRKDSVAVALTLEQAKKAEAGAIPARVVVVADVATLLVGGPAGRKVAIAKEKEAQAALKKRDWSGAGRILDQAIAADPTFAPVRYARAAAEAQGGIGRTAMIENLTWLKTASSSDPSAKKLLEQAKNDRAFDAWTGEPEVRELLGLPAVSTMDVPARLLERAAAWTLQGATCKSPWLTIVFQKGAPKAGVYAGKGTLEIAESCKGKKQKSKQQITWEQSAAGSAFDVVTKAGDVAGTKIPARAMIVLDETYQQLKLKPVLKEGEGEALGNFEPGVAYLDDSTL